MVPGHLKHGLAQYPSYALSCKAPEFGRSISTTSSVTGAYIWRTSHWVASAVFRVIHQKSYSLYLSLNVKSHLFTKCFYEIINCQILLSQRRKVASHSSAADCWLVNSRTNKKTPPVPALLIFFYKGHVILSYPWQVYCISDVRYISDDQLFINKIILFFLIINGKLSASFYFHNVIPVLWTHYKVPDSLS